MQWKDLFNFFCMNQEFSYTFDKANGNVLSVLQIAESFLRFISAMFAENC